MNSAFCRPLRAVVALGLLLSLQGCAYLLPTVPPEVAQQADRQPSVELTQVPFYPQKEYQCGPAALATVFNNLGSKTSPDALVSQVYLPDRKGSLQIEMLATTRRNGYLAYPLPPTTEALFEALNNNTPPVVLMNLALPFYPMWHYAVLVGYDHKKQELIFRSGEEKRQQIELATFLKLWDRGQDWAFVVLDPKKPPPAFAKADTYLQAAAALEKPHPDLAFEAYSAGAARWPDHAGLQFAVGNALYGKNQFKQAEQHYRKALNAQPDFADAWNNLAETLWSQQKKVQARDAARKALAIGGEHASIYEQTAQKMGAKTAD